MKGTVYMDKNKIKRLTDYAVRQCCDNSENCYWSVSYDELYHHFGAEITDSNENGKLLEEELRQREEKDGKREVAAAAKCKGSDGSNGGHRWRWR